VSRLGFWASPSLQNRVLTITLALTLSLISSWVFSRSADAHHTIRPGLQPQHLSPFLPIPAGSPRPEGYASAPAYSCRRGPAAGAQIGTHLLALYLLHWVPYGRNSGIYNCRTVSGSNSLSLHAEGRAFDLGLDAYNPWEKAIGDALFYRFFLGTDGDGVGGAMAKRFGVQEIIWNCNIWSVDRGWRRYPVCDQPGSTKTTRHEDHIHIGQHWYGAVAATTAYSGFSYRHPPF